MLRKQRLNEIAKKEKTINNNLLKNTLSIQAQVACTKITPQQAQQYTTTSIEENKNKVNKIKNNLADLMMKFKNDPTNNTKKIRNRNNMVEIAEFILNFNQLEQERSGLKF